MSKDTNKAKVAAVRLTTGDRDRVEKIAALEKLSPSAWMRNCIIDELARKESLCRRIQESMRND